MKGPGINRLACIAIVGLYGPGFISYSIAAPLPGRVAPFLAGSKSAPLAIAIFPSFALERAMAPAPLDLRVPHDPFVAETRAGPGGFAFRSVSSGSPYLLRGLAGTGANDHDTRSGFDIREADFRVASPVERLVGRVRREGLPIARLWKSESALLSIGLNQRGKPGVWFTKTVR
jgi:hypothetical protein